MLDINDTIAAIATPPGVGGIAVIRISGVRAVELASRIFQSASGSSIEHGRPYSVKYGSVHDPDSSEIIDRGLATLFLAPHSYTGQNCVEISCHAGRVTAARVLHASILAGARLAEPGEFTLRAFLNGKIDLAQAESVADIIHARTWAAQRLARRQMEGAVSQAVRQVRENLIGVQAALEVTIDFSDEVGDVDYSTILDRLRSCRQAVADLLATAEYGRIVREGLCIAITGRPNVGKSSIMNALLGAARAIVTPIAGTTRDLLDESANLCGVPVTLVDSAGIRDTQDVIESIGVERARASAASCDLALMVLDASAGITAEDRMILKGLQESETPTCVVVNKCDVVSRDSAGEMCIELRASDTVIRAAVAASATRGDGMSALPGEIVRAAGADYGEGAELLAESVVVCSARHAAALEAAHASIVEAEASASNHMPADFIAIDVRGAQQALGQITGDTAPDEVIHRIFQDFCVGK